MRVRSITNRRINAGQVDESGAALVEVFDVQREGLLGSRCSVRPGQDLVDVGGLTESVLVAVVPHVLLRDPRRRGLLMPEVDPVNRLIDLPFDVTGIDAFDDHSPTL
jgi:hypothetical protein